MKKNQTNGITSFLSKTHDMVSEHASSHLIHWTDDGNSFVVEDPDRLAREVFPNVFKHTNFASFVRQLNMYGFHKSSPPGQKKSTFAHTYFKRDDIQLCRNIRRKTNMGNSSRSTSRSATTRSGAKRRRDSGYDSEADYVPSDGSSGADSTEAEVPAALQARLYEVQSERDRAAAAARSAVDKEKQLRDYIAKITDLYKAQALELARAHEALSTVSASSQSLVDYISNAGLPDPSLNRLAADAKVALSLSEPARKRRRTATGSSATAVGPLPHHSASATAAGFAVPQMAVSGVSTTSNAGSATGNSPSLSGMEYVSPALRSKALSGTSGSVGGSSSKHSGYAAVPKISLLGSAAGVGSPADLSSAVDKLSTAGPLMTPLAAAKAAAAAAAALDAQDAFLVPTVPDTDMTTAGVGPADFDSANADAWFDSVWQ